MTETAERALVRGSFTLEREYRSAPERTFRAFADPVLKAQWFAGPSDEWEELGAGLDFREGGREFNEGRFHGGIVSRFDAYYHEIVPNERIVYNYEMLIDGEKLSVSLATIEFEPTPSGGTRITITEYGVWFRSGDTDPAMREQGTRELLESLGRVVDA
jgi:uncharacterized protein YndB with AHSA1/START domain